MASIYALTDPRTGEIRYIGKANDPQARLLSHMRDSRSRNTPVYCWIRKVGRPGMVVLKSDSDDWRADEVRLISEAKANGARLLNVAEGGDEPFCSLEVRQANGRKVAASRPQSLMRAYREMESHIRFAHRHGSGNAAALEAKFSAFKQKVEAHRTAGTIEALDAALGRMFAHRRSGAQSI